MVLSKEHDNVNNPINKSPPVGWRTIEEFPDYEISFDCVIRNKKTGHIKKQSIGKRGYLVVSMYKNKKGYLRTVHILYARAFIPNPNNLPMVNHKDGDKTHCTFDNLEWVTAKDNLIHARITGLHTSDGDKKISQYDLEGNKLATFKSASEASRVTGVNHGNLCSVARGNTKYKTAGGYVWKYE